MKNLDANYLDSYRGYVYYSELTIFTYVTILILIKLGFLQIWN